MGRVTKLTGVRKGVASRLSYSFRTSVPVTLTTAFDATNLMTAYRSLRQRTGSAPSITSMIIKTCASVLKERIEFNAVLEEDEIKIIDEVNISVAIDTPQGLLAPVIKNCDKLSVSQIDEALGELQQKALSGQFALSEFTGHTFTVTNLGADGVLYFTPILNPPAICELGVGAIVKKAVVAGERIEVKETGHLSLVFDHRAVDGAPAAKFLARLRQALERYKED